MAQLPAAPNRSSPPEEALAYSTRDLFLASWLSALGHVPQRIEGPRDARTIVFAHIPEQDLEDFYAPNGRVSPDRLFTKYKLLRSRVLS